MNAGRQWVIVGEANVLPFHSYLDPHQHPSSIFHTPKIQRPSDKTFKRLQSACHSSAKDPQSKHFFLSPWLRAKLKGACRLQGKAQHRRGAYLTPNFGRKALPSEPSGRLASWISSQPRINSWTRNSKILCQWFCFTNRRQKMRFLFCCHSSGCAENPPSVLAECYGKQ